MTDISWNHEARLLRTTGAGEETVRAGSLEQLVACVLELSPEAQRGLLIRASGPDWTREWDEHEIRELAARPEIIGAFGRWDSARDPDADGERAPDDPRTLMEADVSGPNGSGEGPVGDLPEDQDERQGPDDSRLSSDD